MFSLDYQSRRPIYEQLYQNVARAAALGAMEPNEQLPSVRALAQELGVNPNTVQKAYQLLERDGLIYSVAGRGSFLSPGTGALEQRREEALKGLGEAAGAAADRGVPREAAIARVEEAYSRAALQKNRAKAHEKEGEGV